MVVLNMISTAFVMPWQWFADPARENPESVLIWWNPGI